MDMLLARTPPMVYYISQLTRFVRVCFKQQKQIFDCLVTKTGYRHYEIRNAFTKFHHRHSELIVKYSISLKQGISESVFYGDLSQCM